MPQDQSQLGGHRDRNSEGEIKMATIKKSDIQKFSVKEAEAKVISLERALLELEGEGKREKKKPVRKAIAKLKTHITSLNTAAKVKAQTLKTKPAPSNISQKK